MTSAIPIAALVAATILLSSCGAKEKFDPALGAPPDAKIQDTPDVNVIQVQNQNRFPLVAARQLPLRAQVNATGVVTPDVTKNIPVISLASGRVVGLYAKLGDDVKQGQLLVRIQSSDLAAAFSDYSKARADEVLARKQIERAQLLHDHGAIATKEVELAEDAAAKAQVDVQTTAERVRILGADINKPSALVDVNAPTTGTIVEQNVTEAAGVKTLDNSPNLFTIANLSSVWIMCDVFENDLPSVRTGDSAEIRLNAYPDRVFHARISNIGKVLDPATRTAKVRLNLANPGIMRAGMFATVTFDGPSLRQATAVPASAVLHLHDRDWVYLAKDDKEFRRTEVVSAGVAPGNMIVVKQGLAPGQQVVVNALELESEGQQ